MFLNSKVSNVYTWFYFMNVQDLRIQKQHNLPKVRYRITMQFQKRYHH